MTALFRSRVSERRRAEGAAILRKHQNGGCAVCTLSSKSKDKSGSLAALLYEKYKFTYKSSSFLSRIS